MNYRDCEKWLKDNRCGCAREIESLSDLRDYETLPRFMNYAFKASCLKCHGKGWPNESALGENMIEIRIGDLVDAPNYVGRGCRLIGIWDDMAWLLYPKDGTTVVSIDKIIPHRKRKGEGHRESIIATCESEASNDS